MSLHNRIKEARKRKGITQTELGNAIGVAKTTIAGYEKNREPTAAQLGAIADVLEVDVTFLLQDEIKQRHNVSSSLSEADSATKNSPSTAEAAPGEDVQKLLEALDEFLVNMGYIGADDDLTEQQQEILIGICRILRATFKKE